MLWLLFYGFLFLIGIVILYFTYNQYAKTQRLLENGIKTTGTVESYITSSGDNGTMYKPVITFKDKRGRQREFVSEISSKPPAYEIGEKVKLVYDIRKDSNVKTVSFWGLYRGVVIPAMIASPFLVIGAAYLLYRLY
ncbi:DUF3592 domain-containing protein [Croceivirga lutea]|uniref:DUF3592 domain-containing protein n=1 Tax=Croceivirga lutea TaxID=1775167 RepID=UPI00163B384A|nr:DUF3592 domain-containing protein [Croceivirga lutea]